MRIAIGKSRMAVKWKNEDWSWEKLMERCSQTLRTKETVAEYKKMTRAYYFIQHFSAACDSRPRIISDHYVNQPVCPVADSL